MERTQFCHKAGKNGITMSIISFFYLVKFLTIDTVCCFNLIFNRPYRKKKDRKFVTVVQTIKISDKNRYRDADSHKSFLENAANLYYGETSFKVYVNSRHVQIIKNSNSDLT